jgi:hypothetical protein
VGQPTNTQTAAVITPAVRVAAQDATGATVATYTGTITIALGMNPSGGSLSGTLAAAAVNGVASFANLSIDQDGDGYTLTATAPTLTAATSASFNVSSSGQGQASLQRIRIVP